MFRLIAFSVALLALLAPAISAPAKAYEYDVVVYGATAGGVVAAIAAADEGHEVALLEPGHHVGGMTSGGLGRTDYGRKQVIGGMSLEFYTRLGKYYDQDIAWFFEPHIAERELRAWLREADVDVYFGSRLDSLEKAGTRITSLTLQNGFTFKAPVFIDCSYEGDTLPLAGISYTWGREGQDQYGESLAGHIEFSPKHQFSVAVNPYDAEGNLLPFVQPYDGTQPGQADKKIQAYNFRLCMTQDKDNMVPWPKPDGYDPAEWELLRRYLAAKPDLTFEELCHPADMPNGKTDTNNNGAISTDFIGANWGYPDGTYEEQRAIWAEHERYVKGFFYFLANDPSVPAALQAEAQRWGLAKDEFVDTGHWPHQLYVREARRMIGTYVTVQKDLQEERHKDASIGMGSYNSDSHNVQRFPVTETPWWDTKGPSVINEGDMQVGVRPYDMSYYSFVPQKAECTNLLVGSTFSASHVAYSSMRMEPQYMIIGHAAGVAASMAIRDKTAVQDVDIARLQAKLYERGSILHREDTIPDYMGAKDLPGYAQDTDQAEVVGNWRESGDMVPFVGYGYLHDSHLKDPANYVRYRVTLPEAGRYELRVAYSPHHNRATNALYKVHHAGGVTEHRVNQRKKPGALAPFVSLDVFDMPAGDAMVELYSTPDSGGYVIADAVQWLPVE